MDALLSIIALALTLVIIYGPLQSAFTAYTRQTIFECRDSLFDMAANGELDFHSVEYREIRKSLERLIRFTHLLTVERLLFFSLFARPAKQPDSMNDFAAKISDAATRDKVNTVIKKAKLATISMMLMKSPLLWLLALVVSPIAAIAFICSKAKTLALLASAETITSRKIETEAFNERGTALRA